jgi:SAM-dependent methyltransferase
MRAALWGDRDRWGLDVIPTDPDWVEWNTVLEDFYDASQQRGVGKWVNSAGYKVMREIDIDGATVLEIGPGTIAHHEYWRGRPKLVHLADVDERMAQRGAAVLSTIDVPVTVHEIGPDGHVPLDDGTVDLIVTFYSLEHVHPIDAQLREFHRVLAPGGSIVGAFPTEGGLAWGLGRWLTTRRWLRHHTSVDPDKIICWEHPNYADTILRSLDAEFDVTFARPWPFRFVPLIDTNLVVTFRADSKTP